MEILPYRDILPKIENVSHPRTNAPRLPAPRLRRSVCFLRKVSTPASGCGRGSRLVESTGTNSGD